DWLKAVLPVIDDVVAAGKTPLIVGGTGFYLSALQGKIDALHAGYNQALRTELSQLSIDKLQGELQRINATRWKNLNDSDRNNPRRLIRAIEITQQLDKMEDTAQACSILPTPYTLHMIGLTMSRQDLYNKIDSRVEKMFNQ